MLFFLLVFGIAFAAAQYQIIDFNNTRAVGPDGPWLPITLRPGFPLQYMDFYPTFNASTNWFVASLNCVNSHQACLESAQRYYDSTTLSALHNPDLSTMRNSSAVPFSDIYGLTGELLNTTGSFGYWHEESIAISDNGTPNFYWGPNISQITSNLTNALFPSGATYVPLSLFTLDPTELYLPSAPNYTPMFGSLLNVMFKKNPGHIGSMSWGMHIGSYSPKINGSLIIGGYDQTRLVGSPGIFTNSRVNLTNVSLGSSPGGFNWTQQQQLSQDFLTAKESNTFSSPLNVSLSPSVPYLYLPSSVCSALASVLPISYNADFNLFTWDTANATYTSLVTSPTYLDFSFNDVHNNPLSIKVPFALLNLTLEAPLVNEPIQYFPCSPTSSTFALGRAFLQAAFIGMNYNSSTFWLAQAPGPNLGSQGPSINPIIPTDTALVAHPNGPSWEETWNGVLTSANSTANSDGVNIQLPPGAIAGIVLGLVAATVISFVVLAWLRRRREEGFTPSDDLSTGSVAKPWNTMSRSWWSRSRKGTIFAEVPASAELKELPGDAESAQAPVYTAVDNLVGVPQPAEVPGNCVLSEVKRPWWEERGH